MFLRTTQVAIKRGLCRRVPDISRGDTAFANTNYWLAGWGRSDIDSSIIVAALSANETASKTASDIRLKGFAVGGGSNGADQDLAEMGMSFWGDYA